MRKLLFLVESSIYNNDGYKTRVEMELEILHENFDIYILAPENVEVLNFQYDVPVYFFSTYKKMPYLYSCYKIRKRLKEVIDKLGDVVVYCEALPSAIAALPVCKAKNIRMVFDCHGDLVSEIKMRHPNLLGRIYSKLISYMQQRVVRYADFVITVSRKQYSLFCTKRKNVLLPMIPSKHFLECMNHREEMRKRLSIDENAVVFVYAGQSQKWQMAQETVKYYKLVEEKQDNTFLLVLTRDTEKFISIIETNRVNNFKVLKVAYQDMPRYLDACDYGFCLRKNHMVNLVSSPTKVMEYLSRNIKPIITRYVGDFSIELLNNGLGVILDDIHEVHQKYEHVCIDGRKYILDRSSEYQKVYLQEMLCLYEK